MKELSIKEKARAYDEALKRAKEINNEQKAQPFDVMLKVFPELKESENERIKETLIDYFKTYKKSKKKFGIKTFFGIPTDNVLAWLERQGEQKPYGQREECLDCQVNYAGECKGFCELKRNEQKPSWSEEDERIIKRIDSLLYAINKSEFEDIHAWLESLKNKVQPKQEWSEQEQVRINRIVSCLENLNVADNDILLKDVDWLKSLKERIGE